MTQSDEQFANPSPESKATEVSAEALVWRYEGLFADQQAAVDFTNLPPAQVAGQAVFSVRENGTTDLFLFR
jgi:hypothetical protein